MKTLQILTLIVVVLITGTTVGQSKENSKLEKQAIKELSENLKKQFKGMPFEEIMCEGKECYLHLSFKVNEEGVVDYYHILSKNKKLQEYSNNILADREIKCDKNAFNEEVYMIKVIFKYNDF